MAFTIWNEADAAYALAADSSIKPQAEVDRFDFDFLVTGIGGGGVVSGCGVTAQGTPNMTVAVAAGTVKHGGTSLAVSANSSLTVAAADATYPRFDLVKIDSSQTLVCLTGTPAAHPVFPPYASPEVPLAAIYIPAGDTAINSDQIVDKRVFVPKTIGAQTVRHNRTSGNLTLNSTTWANVDTGLDITLAAVAGDVIEVGVSGFWGSEATAVFLDVASIVSGSANTSWADEAAPDNTHQGVMGWRGESGAVQAISGSITHALGAGEVSGGNVVLRLRYRTNTGTNKTLNAQAVAPLSFCAKNLGQ